MGLYGALTAGGLWVAAVAGAYFYGVGVGGDQATAAAAREKEIARIATEAATAGAAQAIAKIEVKHVTIRQPLETIIRTEEVFRDCRSGPDAVRLLNATPGVGQPSEPAGDGALPAAAGAAER